VYTIATRNRGDTSKMAAILVEVRSLRLDPLSAMTEQSRRRKRKTVLSCSPQTSHVSAHLKMLSGYQDFLPCLLLLMLNAYRNTHFDTGVSCRSTTVFSSLNMRSMYTVLQYKGHVSPGRPKIKSDRNEFKFWSQLRKILQESRRISS
jgi:hypothetical protein